MARPTWRSVSAEIIASVIAEVGTGDQKALRRALREAYPWGERRYHPYRIWRDEIRRQLDPNRRSIAPGRPPVPHPDQLSLL